MLLFFLFYIFFFFKFLSKCRNHTRSNIYSKRGSTLTWTCNYVTNESRGRLSLESQSVLSVKIPHADSDHFAFNSVPGDPRAPSLPWSWLDSHLKRALTIKSVSCGLTSRYNAKFFYQQRQLCVFFLFIQGIQFI